MPNLLSWYDTSFKGGSDLKGRIKNKVASNWRLVNRGRVGKRLVILSGKSTLRAYLAKSEVWALQSK